MLLITASWIELYGTCNLLIIYYIAFISTKFELLITGPHHVFFTVPPAPILTVVAMYDDRELIRITSQINISVCYMTGYFTRIHYTAISNIN